MRGDLFIGARTPRPPADLRERILRAARAAAEEPLAPYPTAGGWGAWDLALVVAVLVLLLANVLLSLPVRPFPVAPAGSAAVAQQRQLEKELGLHDAVIVAGRSRAGDGEAQRELWRQLERL